MVKALFDTNILIDFLNAVPQAREEFGRYPEKAISIVTWMEVLVGADPSIASPTRAFLSRFTVVSLGDEIAERAVALRRQHRIKLPDAVIWATADVHAMLLVTRDSKHFPDDMPGVRIPYVL